MNRKSKFFLFFIFLLISIFVSFITAKLSTRDVSPGSVEQFDSLPVRADVPYHETSDYISDYNNDLFDREPVSAEKKEKLKFDLSLRMQNSYVPASSKGTYSLNVDSDGDGSYESEYLNLVHGSVVVVTSMSSSFDHWKVFVGSCDLWEPSMSETRITMGESDTYIGVVNNPKRDYRVCSFSISCRPYYYGSSEEVRATLPSSGVILAATPVEVIDGDTVFDVLERVCKAKGIPLTVDKSLKKGYYISSIDNLMEVSVDGNLSGWGYKVDGQYPNKSPSSYRVIDGDSIEWVYQTF